jgi:ABC-type nitrate/sulfonate/bicarbonate transport system substrate-binding protein
MEDRIMFSRRQILRTCSAFGLVSSGLSLGLLPGASTALAADGKPLKPLTIVSSSASLTLTLAGLLQSGHYFSDFGVDATTVNVADGTKINAALIADQADICGGSGFSGLFPAIEKGATLKVLAGAALAPLTGLVSNNPSIKSVSDLVGHTVGVGALGALLHEQVVAVLKKKGIDYHKVTFVNVGSAVDVLKAVTAGTVDAGPIEVGFYDKAAKYNLHPLSDGAFWKELPLYTNQAIFTTDRAIAEKREALVATLAAYCKLYRYIASPASKEAWVKSYTSLGSAFSEEEAIAYCEFFQPAGRLATNLVLSEEQINYIQNLNVELGVQKTVLPFSKVADMSLAQDALKLLNST